MKAEEIKLDVLQIDALRMANEGGLRVSRTPPNEFWEGMRALGLVSFAQVGGEWQRRVTPAGEALLAANPPQCDDCAAAPPIGPHYSQCRPCALRALSATLWPDRARLLGPWRDMTEEEREEDLKRGVFDLDTLSAKERARVDAWLDKEVARKAALRGSK